MTTDILVYEQRDGAAWLTLNRPEVRNALARELVSALRGGIERALDDPSARAIVLAGAGPVFCAGADVNQYVQAGDRDEVTADAARLYDLLENIATCAKPVIARVQKAAFGGAIGLVAAADLVVAAQGTRFSLSEARLGLVPAAIGPAFVRAVGPHHAKSKMLLAEPFGPEVAQRIGLIHDVDPESGLDDAVRNWLSHIHLNAPGSLRDVKSLVNDIAFGTLSEDALRERCTSLAADRRADPEGQEGMQAFLDKRRPAWIAEA
jgi:methylglutaconyl-CoA hydratase